MLKNLSGSDNELCLLLSYNILISSAERGRAEGGGCVRVRVNNVVITCLYSISILPITYPRH